MYLEEPFNGTPYGFAKAVRDFFSVWENHHDREWQGFQIELVEGKIERDAEFASAKLSGMRDGLPAICQIKVRHLPIGNLISRDSDTRDWVVLEKGWLTFRKFLAQRGLVGEVTTLQVQLPDATPTKRITSNQKAKQERQAKVKEYCEGGMTVAEMARKENVSEPTINRDIADLRKAGKIER